MYCVLDAPSIVHCHFLSWVLHLFKRLVLGSARSSEDLTWKLCSTYQNDHTEFASAPSSAALDASSSLRVSILCGTFISSSPPVAVAGSREVPHGEENINLPVPKGYWWHPIIYKPKALLLSREDACVSWTDHLCICQVDRMEKADRIPCTHTASKFPLVYHPFPFMISPGTAWNNCWGSRYCLVSTWRAREHIHILSSSNFHFCPRHVESSYRTG